VFPQPWPVTVTPVAVNMVCHPVPKASRMISLGRAIATAVESFPADHRVVVVGTGGMSHQISGARFGIANSEFNVAFLDALPDHLDLLLATPVEEMMRVGGTEASELVLWYAMRAALPGRVRTLAKFHAFPAITGCGALVLAVGEEPA
jgi:aromatic ring-opening dioxygenase catalytic subunit (LigB family)